MEEGRRRKINAKQIINAKVSVVLLLKTKFIFFLFLLLLYLMVFKGVFTFFLLLYVVAGTAVVKE